MMDQKNVSIAKEDSLNKLFKNIQKYVKKYFNKKENNSIHQIFERKKYQN